MNCALAYTGMEGTGAVAFPSLRARAALPDLGFFALSLLLCPVPILFPSHDVPIFHVQNASGAPPVTFGSTTVVKSEAIAHAGAGSVRSLAIHPVALGGNFPVH